MCSRTTVHRDSNIVDDSNSSSNVITGRMKWTRAFLRTRLVVMEIYVCNKRVHFLRVKIIPFKEWSKCAYIRVIVTWKLGVVSLICRKWFENDTEIIQAERIRFLHLHYIKFSFMQRAQQARVQSTQEIIFQAANKLSFRCCGMSLPFGA